MGVGGALGQDSRQDGERVDPIHSQSELYLKLWELVGPSATHLPWETYGGWGRALLSFKWPLQYTSRHPQKE